MIEKSGPRISSTQPVDASLLEPSLSPEIVTSGEIESMLRVADYLLKEEGVESTVNGMPAIVSEGAIPVRVKKKNYYARLYKFEPSKENPDQGLPAIAFDETFQMEVITANPYALRFSKYGDKPSIIADQDELNPVPNSPAHVELAKSILQEFAHQHVEAKHIADENVAQRRIEKSKHRHEVAGIIGRASLKAAKVATALVAAGGIIGGAVYGVGKIHISHFDDKKLSLIGGTEISIGSTGHPEYSPKLFSNKQYSEVQIPDLVELPNAATPDMGLNPKQTLREVIILSSKKGKNCETRAVKRVPLDTRLVAWTDFTGQDGQSRADELDVDYKVGELKVCWNGQELGPEDDPRVVVALRSASESTPK